jgi:hypothetical protein
MKSIIIRNLIGSVVALLVFTVFFVFVVPSIKSYEELNYPVVDNVALEKIKRVDGKLHLYFTFDKLRGCEFIHLDALQNGRRVGYIFGEDDSNTPISREQGKHSIGPVILDISNIDNLSITTVHKCNILYDTRSNFYT